MKKIIDGRKYDTETAVALATYSDGKGWRDFSHFEETLYRKKTGEFFLHGSGGPMTKYSRSRGQNEWSGGDEIIPLKFEAARKWAEEHMDVEEYEEIFGEGLSSKTVIRVKNKKSASIIRKGSINTEIGAAMGMPDMDGYETLRIMRQKDILQAA